MKTKVFTLIAISLLIGACTNQEKLKNELKEEIKKELQVEPKKKPYITKGDGSHFYSEPISIGGESYNIHHSTLACPYIQNGVQRDCFKIDYYHNIFCSVCMDNNLIDTFNERNNDKMKKR